MHRDNKEKWSETTPCHYYILSTHLLETHKWTCHRYSLNADVSCLLLDSYASMWMICLHTINMTEMVVGVYCPALSCAKPDFLIWKINGPSRHNQLPTDRTSRPNTRTNEPNTTQLLCGKETEARAEREERGMREDGPRLYVLPLPKFKVFVCLVSPNCAKR